MAQKRMLNKTISVSKQVNKLSLKSKLIYTWSIPHLDDYGYLTKDTEVYRAIVFPMSKEITEEDIEIFFKEAINSIDEYGIALIEELSDCYFFTGFENHQKITENKKSKCKFKAKKINPQETPRISEKPQKSPLEVKISKDKISKDKITTKVVEKTQEFGNKDINTLLKVFEDAGFKVTTKQKMNRYSANRLIKKYGLLKATRLAEYALSIINQPYAPQVTNVLDLEQKLNKVLIYWKKQKPSEVKNYD